MILREKLKSRISSDIWKKKGKRILSLLMSMLLLLNSFAVVQASGANNEAGGVPLKDKYVGFEGKEVVGDYSDLQEAPSYLEYVTNVIDSKDSISEDFEIAIDSVRDHNGETLPLEEHEGREAFIWSHETNYIEFDVEMPESGIFQVEFDYYLQTGESIPGIRSLYIDEQYPFEESNELIFYKYFKDKNEPILNSLGDQTRPSQIEMPGWRTQKIINSSGLHPEPFKIHLEKGDYTFKMNHVQGTMAIAGIRIVVPDEVLSYEEVKEQYIANGYEAASADSIKFQSELTTIEKNDPTLRREDDGDPLAEPQSSTNRILNVMGGYRWRDGNQKMTWEFDVPEDGLYKIGLRVKQEWQDGVPSYRKIEIDGKIPFSELTSYQFDYSTKWNTNELSDKNGEVFEFYLTKGTHTISMTNNFGPLNSVIDSLKGDMLLLSDILLNITLIAGAEPDPNYDYGFFNRVPDMKENMIKLAQSMQEKYDLLDGMTEKTPAMANNFLTIMVQMDDLINNPFSIAKRVRDLQNTQENLSNWFLELQKSPLVIDYFMVGPKDEVWPNKQSNIFQRIGATLSNFVSSFEKDYDSVGGIINEDVEITETIDVWIARGMEWAEVIKELADEQFTPETGISIRINVVPAGQLGAGTANVLMLSIISGMAPDVALGIDKTSPVEFAIRDAAYDLSEFPDFDEVSGRFVNQVMTPYEYEGGVYALPETMNFNVMYYRTDIMQQYGIDLPNTREELYNYVLPSLYQNGLQYYYARDFTQFLFQHGGDFYTEDGYRSGLDSPEAYAAFKEYTELFTHYGVPEVANFYQMMRNGIMPLGIGDFNLYMQLSVAAPELAGKWGIATLPGTVREDGTIDRTAGQITAEGDVILKQSEKAESSWEFLKWWSSADVQTSFAREVEALMGAEARWNTANVEAFENLSWPLEHIEVIQEQWDWAREMPNVLGGYFTDRHLTNAWTTTVVSGGEARNALEQAVKDINRELRMKQEEYGIDINAN